MPSCILRVSGSIAKVRTFLASASISPDRVFWKGEPGRLTSRGPIKSSGFNIALSSAEQLDQQATEAARFIRKHMPDLLLVRELGFATRSIDFGLYDLVTDEHPWPSYRVPSGLVSLAGELGCAIELSFYGPAPTAA